VKSRTVRLHLLSCSLAPWRTQALDNCSGVDLQQAGGFLLGIPIPGCWQWLEWTPVRPRTPGPWRRACISPRDEIRPFQPGCHVPSKRQKTHSGSRNEKCLSRGGGGRRREIKKKKKRENATRRKASEFSNKPESAENTFYKHAAKLAAFVWAFVKH